MSLPPALLARLAQRGLVQKQKVAEVPVVENEEVIAEDYDEMDTEEQQVGPERYDHLETRKLREDNFWRERMKARMSETNTAAGHKGCPNKYNIWHKCTLFCATRWGDGITEPGRLYMRRYKRLLRKYPLPKGWTEMYDPGCGAYYFYCAADSVVSWLPPTHPKSHVTKTAAALRRQLVDEAGGGDRAAGGGGSDGEATTSDDDDDGGGGGDDSNDEAASNKPGKRTAERSDAKDTSSGRHQREIDSIISASLRKRPTPVVRQRRESPVLAQQDFPSLQETTAKVKARDAERGSAGGGAAAAAGLRKRPRDRERHAGGRGGGRHEAASLDPMDPSSYSDIPRGKWSDGLPGCGEEAAKKAAEKEEKKKEQRERRDAQQSDDEDGEEGVEEDYE